MHTLALTFSTLNLSCCKTKESKSKCVHFYAHLLFCMRVCAGVRVYVCMCVCICVRVCVCARMYVCMYVRECVYLFVYMYMYMCVGGGGSGAIWSLILHYITLF